MTAPSPTAPPHLAAPHLAAQVRHVVQAATLAPSVHNTQPWRFVQRPDGFDLLADASRQLPVLDPTGRQLHLSCGAALLTARVAARALGLDPRVELLPEDGRPELLARLTLTTGAPANDAELALALAVLARHTVRDAFATTPLPDELHAVLRCAAEAEGAAVRRVVTTADRVELAVLLSAADAAQTADPELRAELAAWLHDPATGDGLPPEAVPSLHGRGTSLRQRDFLGDTPESCDGSTPVAEEPEVLVLTTAGDGPRAWLAAGQALGALLLHAAQAGVQAQPLGQVTDLPGPRAALARVLGVVGTPQLVLRLGYADATALTPRRAVDDVLV